MTKYLILALLAAAPIAPPALAQQTAPANPTVLVAHHDLNLATDRGARTLYHRVRHAVTEVCGTASDFDLEGKNDIRQCRKETLRIATTKADTVIAGVARDRPIQVTSAGN